MSATMRDLSPEERAEAEVRAYAAYYLTGRSAIEIIDRTRDAMADAMAMAQRGDIERAKRLISIARAGLAMVSESLGAAGVKVTVAMDSPLLRTPPAG